MLHRVNARGERLEIVVTMDGDLARGDDRARVIPRFQPLVRVVHTSRLQVAILDRSEDTNRLREDPGEICTWSLAF